MQTAYDRVPPGDVAPPSLTAVSTGPVSAETRLRVATGRVLFSPGEKRHLYRVESGAVCHHARWPDGRLEVIEFAFPGDLIGFGYLFAHTSSAVAMVDTVVSTVSDVALSQAMARDSMLGFSLAEAGEREFEFLRMTSRPAVHLPALQALARYLLVISSVNETEGRGGFLALDDVSSDYVARQLHMSSETLSMALLSLARSGLVEMSGNGCCIGDVARLEALAR